MLRLKGVHQHLNLHILLPRLEAPVPQRLQSIIEVSVCVVVGLLLNIRAPSVPVAGWASCERQPVNINRCARVGLRLGQKAIGAAKSLGHKVVPMAEKVVGA